MFKSDQEASLGDLLQEVVKRRGDAKWRRPQANGVIERENLSVDGHVMVLKDAFERLGKKVPGDHAALAWLVEFAAVLINRYEVGPRRQDPVQAAQGEVVEAVGARVRGAAALQELPGGSADGEARRQLAGRGILWVPVVERRGCRGNRGGRAED